MTHIAALLSLALASVMGCGSGSGQAGQDAGPAGGGTDGGEVDGTAAPQEGGSPNTQCYGPAPNGSDCPPGYCFVCGFLDVNPTPSCGPRFCSMTSTFTGASCITAECSNDAGLAADAQDDSTSDGPADAPSAE
jgi:hypothetical protein